MQNVQIKISNGLTERVRDRWIPDLGLGSFKERVEAKEHLLNDLVETFSLTLSPSEKMFIVLQSKLNNVIFSENDSD